MPSGIIDTFTVEVLQPVEQSWQYLFEKHRYGIKYEIVCAIGNPKIVWLSGPWRGTASDPTIARKSGIKSYLHENEALLSDKIYRGDRQTFLTAVPGHTYVLEDEEKAYNFLVYSARNSVERLIRRITSSGIFQHVWRFSFKLHKKCMKAVSKLVNFTLIFEPLG